MSRRGRAFGGRMIPKRGPLDPHEDDWAETVDDYADLRGWWHYHETDSRKSPPGLPDRLFVRPPRVVFVELKVPGGQVEEEQRLLLDLLAACPCVECYEWLPSDWPTVVEVLR